MKHEILMRFCSDEEIRPAMQNPFIDKDFVCATNGHIAVIIPKSLSEKDYSQNPSMKIMDLVNEAGSSADITKINLALFEPPKKPLYEKTINEVVCKECDGDGETTCFSCGHTHECEKCGGEGVVSEEIITDKIIGDQIDEDSCLVNISLAYYNPKYVNLIKSISDTWSIRNLHPMRASLWESGDIRVLLMPKRFGGDKSIKIIKIEESL